MSRVCDYYLSELIANDGILKHSGLPPNTIGIVRMALDLKEAREKIEEQRIIIEKLMR